jgi:hypothetical protein
MRAAILIVGSLLWRTSDQRRVVWRQRLDVEGKLGVGALIYYGRLSRSRTYTMTFGGARDSGRAVLVPCRAPVGGLDDLVAEAQALWAAEFAGAALGSIGTGWGCVGARCRGAAAELAPQWADWFRGHATPVAAVDAAGVLGVPWPQEAEGSDVEIMLATSTRPERRRPTPQQMADAWIAEGGEDYFFRNVEHGIRTPDDQAIWRAMQARQAACLAKAEWARAIAILRSGEGAAE